MQVQAIPAYLDAGGKLDILKGELITVPTGFTGKTVIEINQETMNQIVQNWINQTIGGGAYKVTNVESKNYDEYFKVSFEREALTKDV